LLLTFIMRKESKSREKLSSLLKIKWLFIVLALLLSGYVYSNFIILDLYISLKYEEYRLVEILEKIALGNKFRSVIGSCAIFIVLILVLSF